MPATTLSRNSTNVRNYLALLAHRAALALTSAWAPDKAVRKAARLFASPPRFAHTERELDLLATGTRFEILTDMGSLVAWRFGGIDRPVVLLSHGWGGRGAQMRALVAPLLEAGYQVVLFDHAGHGYSGGTESSLIHFRRGIEAVVDSIESRGGRLAGLVGHSLGAAAAGIWLNDTGRALRAVFIAPPTSLRRYAGYFARRIGLAAPLRDAMQRHFEERLGRPWDELELPTSVARVKAEALVIHDRDDRDVAFASGLELARSWPGARFAATRGLGHRGVLRDAQVARDVADFIAGRVAFAPPPARGERQPFGAPSPLM